MADLKGLKRICMSCGARFYDLNKKPIICPTCATEFTGEIKVKSRRGRLPADAISGNQIEDAEAETTDGESAATEEIEQDEELVSLEDIEDGDDDDIAEDEDDIDMNDDLDIDEDLEDIEEDDDIEEEEDK